MLCETYCVNWLIPTTDADLMFGVDSAWPATLSCGVLPGSCMVITSLDADGFVFTAILDFLMHAT